MEHRMIAGTDTEKKHPWPGIDKLYSTNSWQGVHEVQLA